MDFSRVIDLYSDCSKEVLELIVRSFSYAALNDKEYALKEYEYLCNIKECFPSFRIEIDEKKDRAYFDSLHSVIVLPKYDFATNLCDFFHELTHAFHYYQNGLATPEGFYYLYNQLNNDNDFHKRCVDIINFFYQQKNVLREQLFEMENKSLKKEMSEYNNILCELRCIQMFEDIIDSLTKGTSSDKGLCFIKDENSFVEKSNVSAGHNSDYYQNQDNIFIEIIAEYSAIRKTEFKDKFFQLLGYVLGNEFMLFLEEYYRQLVSNNFEINIEDTIKK